MPAAPSIPPDSLLGGKIRLIQRIGRGGMGDVWVARNESTQAEVAVKTLVKAERNAVNDERFRREARLAATVSHRNVVRIFDLVDDAAGTLGLVMELLRGGTLEACMRERGPLSSLHAVAVAVPILSALHHVHEKGIIHRDVKPANVFFAVEPDGHVIPKILDFGIAKLPAAGSALTMDGSVLGTPHYMSPEQIRGAEDLDGRSDMFSMAVVLYEMLTGVRVFQRDTAAASLAAVLEHEVDPDPRIEPRLWVAISRALAKRPYERYGNCSEFADALKNAIDASDEDFAASLQELRPHRDVGVTGERASGARPIEPGSGASSQASARPKKKAKKNASLMWTVVAAGGAALLAVGVTYAVVKPGSHADDSPASSSSSTSGVPSGAIVLSSPTGARDRDTVPPPSDSGGAVIELQGDSTATPPKPPSRPVSVIGRNPGISRPPVVTTSRTPKPPATKPDF